jgi:hypothetical protein
MSASTVVLRYELTSGQTIYNDMVPIDGTISGLKAFTTQTQTGTTTIDILKNGTSIFNATTLDIPANSATSSNDIFILEDNTWNDFDLITITANTQSNQKIYVYMNLCVTGSCIPIIPVPITGDTDAAIYLLSVTAQGGTYTPTAELAVNTLFTDLKTAGLYNKLKVMYPIVGGNAASHALNALSPTTSNTFYLTFSAGWTHNVSGMTHSAGAYYADTHFIPSVEYSTIESSMGYYNNTPPVVGDGYIMGAYNSGTQWWSANYQASNNFFMIHFQGNSYFNSLSKLTGFAQTSSNLTNKYAKFTNSVDNVSTSGSAGGTRPTVPMYLGNLNLNGNPHKSDAGAQLCFAYMGDYLTASEQTTMSTIVQTFQTSLNRQV